MPKDIPVINGYYDDFTKYQKGFYGEFLAKVYFERIMQQKALLSKLLNLPDLDQYQVYDRIWYYNSELHLRNNRTIPTLKKEDIQYTPEGMVLEVVYAQSQNTKENSE